MTTVYGVWSGYEDMDGIFSTKEKAEEYVRWMLATGKYSKDQFSVLDYTIDVELTQSSDSCKERK